MFNIVVRGDSEPIPKFNIDTFKTLLKHDLSWYCYCMALSLLFMTYKYLECTLETYQKSNRRLVGFTKGDSMHRVIISRKTTKRYRWAGTIYDSHEMSRVAQKYNSHCCRGAWMKTTQCTIALFVQFTSSADTKMMKTTCTSLTTK